MKPESLHALLIDRELGELSPEVGELLEAWQAEHPESGAVLSSIRRTLETASAAVRRFPKLGQPPANGISLSAARFRLMPLALAASIFLLLGATAWVGFRVGQRSALAGAAGGLPGPAPARTVNPGQRDGPWARYAVSADPRGGLTVVRREAKPRS